MGVEIERKFLLKYFPGELLTCGTAICQGYMINQKKMVVRVRISGDHGFLTLKGAAADISRKEFEYPVPKADAEEMLSLFCQKPWIEKIRYPISFKGFEWIIDQFSGDNQGLCVAEIELTSIEQPFEKPDWVGKEVTHDPRYFNSNLIQAPYVTWK